MKQKEQTGVNESGAGGNNSVFEKKVVFKAALLVISFLLLQSKITPKKIFICDFKFKEKCNG